MSATLCTKLPHVMLSTSVLMCTVLQPGKDLARATAIVLVLLKPSKMLQRLDLNDLACSILTLQASRWHRHRADGSSN